MELISDKCYEIIENLFCCTGAPIIATLPHFYKAEEYLKDVDGLSPQDEKHRIKMLFEPVSRCHVHGLIKYI